MKQILAMISLTFAVSMLGSTISVGNAGENVRLVKAIGQTVDLNKASVDELVQLPGIGLKKAKEIVNHRRSSPFRTIDEINGHEPAGIVAEVGPNVTNLSVGDRVCVYHRVGCGHCMDCRSGYAAFCDDVRGAFGRTQDGSHADYMLTDAHYCLPLPDELSFEVATQLACTAGTSFSALRKIPAHSGDTLVVFGLGPVGLSGLLLGIGIGMG